jgi:enoyl-CoA hydratase
MTPELITVEIEEGVGIVTLNRPEVLNAMNNQLSTELHEAVRELNANEDVGCVVITGTGNRAFSAGGDIHEQRENDRKYTREELDTRGAVRSRGGFELSVCAKPIIGMINGLAYGGGSVLASSLDFRIGCEHASFRFLATAYGRINSTWTLPNQVGWPMAKELLFTARVIGAEESYRIGLLNHLVPCEQLKEKTMEIATTIAKNKQESVIGVKTLLNRQMGKELEEQWAMEKDYTTNVSRGTRSEEAFPEFIARRGRPLSS